MEKIREALDRARQERGESPPVTARSAAVATSAAPLPELDVRVSAGGAVARYFEPDLEHLARHRVLAPNAIGPVADAFRLLRTQVLDRMQERGWQTIGVISPRSLDGKSTIAANLAITIASDPRHTSLLVDLDLRRPGIDRLFGMQSARGVEHILRGEASIEECLVNPVGYSGVRVLPAVSNVEGSSGLMTDGRCRVLVAELRERYANRVIVFDVPPVLDADNALLVAPQLDCLLLVVSEGITSREDVVRTLQLTHRTPVVGTVLNRSSAMPRADVRG